MVKLRLIPTGKSAQPSFRIVVMDARVKLNSEYIDILGFYDPIKKIVKINEELAIKFLLTGAQPTDTVRKLLSKEGIIAKFNSIKIERKKLQTKSNEIKEKKTSSDSSKITK